MTAKRSRILLFHRLELADLFAGLAGPLAETLDVQHLAYDQPEVAHLATLGITVAGRSFKEDIAALYPTASVTPALLEEIDTLIVTQTGGAFTLNSAIQSDRGFSLLTYDEALRLTATYYLYWNRFIAEQEIDFLLHEPCTLMFNFLPALILSQRGGRYLYNIMATGKKGTINHLTMTGFDFTCPDLDRAFDDITAGRQSPDRTEAAAFLAEFRQSYEVFLGARLGRRQSPLRQWAGAVYQGVVQPMRRAGKDRVLDNIDYWQASRNRSLDRYRNLRAYRHVRFDKIVPGERYFFYPLHLEPEAVVLYHAHGIYENQTKLIQNIAGQLPPGCMLYVKDHPHDHAYRNPIDYHRLTSVPNIRLLAADIPGKEVIRHAQGVITITGTAGFEAMLLGKQVYTFGKTFYSRGPRVQHLHHIRDLRAALYARRDEAPITDDALIPFVAAYLATLKPGLTDFFVGRAQKYGIDLTQNARNVAQSLLQTIAGL
ncbi:hypothetical protein [Cypionkella sp.]|uniref:capsular polysaccharide export protein, LipB/KpsS family n=1 Tax=Cypionkella sp. TaxID=2811411 RepID=UPI00271ACF61|nr:hypothetical protein [Cypionkella sp.]MDO8982378.1 hypothetical protein [Cypionkella sp.]MDP1577087.1 hypothetical protein [Cypionkella sp.]MDP2050628.1 hypothetical protein [Cypionkella sp.]